MFSQADFSINTNSTKKYQPRENRFTFKTLGENRVKEFIKLGVQTMINIIRLPFYLLVQVINLLFGALNIWKISIGLLYEG